MDPDERAAVVGWLRRHAVPLATCEPGSGTVDLRPLRQTFEGARVVGLGEATHGTREFFLLKHRFMELLAGECAFTAFGIEAGFHESTAVDDFVLGGDGDPVALVTGTRFWTWDTDEVLGLVRWMRSTNDAGRCSPPLRFHGVDVQHPPGGVLALLDYFGEVDPAFGARVLRGLGSLGNDHRHRTFDELARPTRRAVARFAASVCTALDAARASHTKLVGELRWARARMHAEVLSQSARMLADLRNAWSLRDRAMAENACALLEHDGPGARMALWAHNGHVQRTEQLPGLTPMGRVLHDMLGPAYVPVGFVFNRGSFRAGLIPGGPVQEFTVGPGPDDSLDRVLADVGHPVFAVDLRRVPASGPVAAWMATQPATRSIGAGYAHDRDARFWRRSDPRQSFDVLVFVDDTTAARSNGQVRPYVETVRHRRPVNLDFAAGRVGDVPTGWSARVGPAAGAFRVGVVDDTDRRAVEVSRSGAPWRWGIGRLEQCFDARPYRGQTLVFSAELAVERLTPTTEAQLCIEVAGNPERRLLRADLGARGAASQRPRRRAVSVAVPDDARTITVACALVGDGRLVVRAPRIDCPGPEV